MQAVRSEPVSVPGIPVNREIYSEFRRLCMEHSPLPRPATYSIHATSSAENLICRPILTGNLFCRIRESESLFLILIQD